MTEVRERLGFVVGGLAAILIYLALSTAAIADPGPNPALARADAEVTGSDKTPTEELAEKKEKRLTKLQRRLDALAAAEAAGRAGQPGPNVGVAAAPGWAGETPMDSVGDDWEPAIAADPNAPYVYVLTTRYGVPKPCPGNCPTPWIALEVSSDAGATWSAGSPLCACKGSGQFDPIIEVVPSNGHVYAAFMIGFNVVFVKSTDHGATWSLPVKTYGNISWNDKPVLAMSNDGRHVYISWNGPSGGDPYIAQSHDFGATWTQRKLVDSARYYFAFDADVDAAGVVYLSESSILYGGGGNKGTVPTGTIDHHVFISRDQGVTWENRVVASVLPGVACDAAGCSPDFYLGHSAFSADANGDLVYLYDGATTAGGPQTIEARRSIDDGVTWGAPVVLSTIGENATAPAVESVGSGDVRAFYYQTAGASDDAWNVWYRSSTNGGATWLAPVKISDASTGAAYKSAAGFLEIYGDYGEMAITSTGKAIAIWGEGFSWDGPGGSWFNRQP